MHPTTFFCWRNPLHTRTAGLSREAGQVISFNFKAEFVVAAVSGSLADDVVLSTLGGKKFLVCASKVGHEQFRIGTAFSGVDF
jgi:hypothetical protein